MDRFFDRGTADIANGRDTRAARATLPISLWRVGARKIDLVLAAGRLESLNVPPSNRLELLHGSRAGQYSIRINDKYRICFVWTDEGAGRLEITDYH